MSDPANLTIRSGQGDYEVAFVEEIAKIVERVLTIPRAVFVVDRNVARAWAEVLRPVLERPNVLLLDATEDEKSLRGVETIGRALQQANATKQSTLIAFGGGITQDLCALTAHLYYRGIPWVFVPTTLLAQSDSCIGAKCGINFGSFKNQLGCFQSPASVLLSTRFTETLTDADVASGYGEILKLMLTGSAAHFRDLASVLNDQPLRNAALPRLIRACLEVKKGVIEADEYERDRRRILNYGHTFGHALESLTDHRVPHGLGVAWGMDLVNFLAWRRGRLDESTFLEIHALIAARLSCRLERPLDASALIAFTKRDKKVADGQISLVLLSAPGALDIVKTPYDEHLEQQVAEYVRDWNAFAVAP